MRFSLKTELNRRSKNRAIDSLENILKRITTQQQYLLTLNKVKLKCNTTYIDYAKNNVFYCVCRKK